jgi:hypothetical protein
MPWWLWVIIIALVVIAMGFGFLKLWVSEPGADWLQLKAEVKAMPFEDAVAEAEEALRKVDRFAVSGGAEPPSEQWGIDPVTSEFLAKYGRIESLEWPGVVSADIRRSIARSGYLRLGEEMEHTEVAIAPENPVIYVLGDDVPDDRQVEAEYPSIYHYVVWLSRASERLVAMDQDGEG